MSLTFAEANPTNILEFFFFLMVENIVGKGENADYQYFLFP